MNTSEKIRGAFKKVNPHYKIKDNIIIELVYMGTSPKALRELNRSKALENPNTWKRTSWKKAKQELAQTQKSIKSLLVSLKGIHSISFDALLYFGYSAKHTAQFLKELNELCVHAVDYLKKGEKHFPDNCKSLYIGRPKNLINQHIANLVAEEYFKATGRRPTLTNSPISKKPDKIEGEPAGKFYELLKDILVILEIKGNAAGLAKLAANEWKLKEEQITRSVVNKAHGNSVGKKPVRRKKVSSLR